MSGGPSDPALAVHAAKERLEAWAEAEDAAIHARLDGLRRIGMLTAVAAGGVTAALAVSGTTRPLLTTALRVASRGAAVATPIVVRAVLRRLAGRGSGGRDG